MHELSSSCSFTLDSNLLLLGKPIQWIPVVRSTDLSTKNYLTSGDFCKHHVHSVPPKTWTCIRKDLTSASASVNLTSGMHCSQISPDCTHFGWRTALSHYLLSRGKIQLQFYLSDKVSAANIYGGLLPPSRCCPCYCLRDAFTRAC